MRVLESEAATLAQWMESSRFDGIRRLHSASDVLAQRGTIENDYPIARRAAEKFYPRLRELFAQRAQITTFGPYSPGQAVAMKRMGIEAIYLGGWATSAKGSLTEDPGPDLASYPLSQVPDEAATLVRALLTADRNQHFNRVQMTDAERRATPAVDFQPFIIADADTGHGGDAHVRNLIRRFVEVGVPGYHIEDQKPGAKKCGHQAGKVLVGCDEQIKRLNAARFQLDIMGVPGIIVARTDAEAATLLENRADERDQPFILGATNVGIPSYKAGYAALLKTLSDQGITEARGHFLFAMSDIEHRAAVEWFEQVGFMTILRDALRRLKGADGRAREELDALESAYADLWQSHAGMKTYGEAVAAQMTLLASEGQQFDLSVDEWSRLAARSSFYEARARATQLGIDVAWDCELPKTPDGYYHVQGGIPYAIAKSLAAAPFADLIWMETKTADLADAREFATAIHAVFPDKMLAYNLSPSFNWDTTGMTDEQMTRFPEELGKLGYVFDFITYGGHQIDGLAAEEFAASLKQEGMLALARLQRQFRLLDSPYRTPQALVGGPRLDAALMASSGGTAATKAMSKGSTHYQHLMHTEVSPALLEEWLDVWRQHYGESGALKAELRPHTPGSDLMQLKILDAKKQVVLNVVFATIQDRRGRTILSIRDQNTIASLRKRRLMTLAQLFLIHRYKAGVVHYVTPTEDNEAQTAHMKTLGIFTSVSTEVGQIIVAHVSQSHVAELLKPRSALLDALIHKKSVEHR